VHSRLKRSKKPSIKRWSLPRRSPNPGVELRRSDACQ
jgi:hypothetical protein